jgi:hypothetical protein
MNFRRVATRNKNRKREFVDDMMLKPNVYDSMIFTASSSEQDLLKNLLDLDIPGPTPNKQDTRGMCTE